MLIAGYAGGSGKSIEVPTEMDCTVAGCVLLDVGEHGPVKRPGNTTKPVGSD